MTQPEYDPNILAMNEEELFARLGGEILADSRMGLSLSKAQKHAFGRDWFRKHIGQIKKAVCHSKLIEDLAAEGDTASLVVAIGPLLGFSASGAAIAIIAVLIVRIGVRRICADAWDERRPSTESR